MHSNGEELHPNWRALATVHLPLKRFVKPCNHEITKNFRPYDDQKLSGLCGLEVKKFYEEVLNEKRSTETLIDNIDKGKSTRNVVQNKKIEKEQQKIPFDRKKFFHCAQMNDITGLKSFSIQSSDDLNSCDEFGWTALMVASCEGSFEAVKILLELGANKYLKDKTGKIALDLARRRAHSDIVDILENDMATTILEPQISQKEEAETNKTTSLVPFYCEICHRTFTETTVSAHQTSTVHQFNMKSLMPPNKLERFNIPNRNRGLQLMVKQGWDKESGLGPSENGRLYPVKTVIRNKRTGIGIEQPPARVTHFNAFDVRAIQRKGSDYYEKKAPNRNDMRREKIRDWKRNRRLRNELS